MAVRDRKKASSKAGEAKAKAHAYAMKNMSTNQYGQMLKIADIMAGECDEDARSVTAGGRTLNAVYVIARRAQANGNRRAGRRGRLPAGLLPRANHPTDAPRPLVKD